MSKEVTKKQNNEVAVYNDEALASWGGNEFDQSDIIIPKIILMQGASQLVADGIAKPGEYIHSVTKEVLGSKDSPVTITPLHMKKFWRVSKPEGTKYVFERMDHVTQESINAPKEFLESGINKKRQMVYQFYVLIDGYAVPFIIQMKGMSHGAGKQLANEMFVTNKIKKLPPPGRQFKLSVEDAEYEGTKYKAYKTIEPSNTPEDMVMGLCYEWFKTINAGEVLEDNTDEDVLNAAASDINTNEGSDLPF